MIEIDICTDLINTVCAYSIHLDIDLLQLSQTSVSVRFIFKEIMSILFVICLSRLFQDKNNMLSSELSCGFIIDFTALSTSTKLILSL